MIHFGSTIVMYLSILRLLGVLGESVLALNFLIANMEF